MTTITFDTHKFIKQLEVAGIPAVHAEAFVNAQRDILSEALDSTLATRADMLSIKSEIKGIELKIDSKLAELKADLIKWVVGLALAQSGLMVGLLIKLA